MKLITLGSKRVKNMINVSSSTAPQTSHGENMTPSEDNIVSFKWEVPHSKETICSERLRPGYRPLMSTTFQAAEGLRMRGVIPFKKEYYVYCQLVASVEPGN